MASVKMMAISERLVLPLTQPIENAIADVEQPGAKAKEERGDQRQMQMHGAGEEPRPKSGNGGRIQAEQVPPFRQVVEALGQDLVYFGQVRERTW